VADTHLCTLCEAKPIIVWRHVTGYTHLMWCVSDYGIPTLSFTH